MQRIPTSPPPIPPLPPGTPRLRWSVMIPAYNCSPFLKQAIESVLAQDMGEENMQIEVVDDGSTDADVAKLVADVGKGRVSYFRQSKNVGSLRNFETCINRARGQYLHLLHGDDYVKHGFYKKLDDLFAAFPAAGAAFTAWDTVDEHNNIKRTSVKEIDGDGLIPDWFYKIVLNQRLQYACIAVKREVYEKLGGFFGVTYGEDWEMWARISKHYTVAYSPQILACYREHSASISGQSFLSGKNIRDIAQVIQTISTYLPEAQRKRLNRKARGYYIHWAFNHAKHLWETTGNKKAVYAQIRTMLGVYADRKLLMKTARLMQEMHLPFTINRNEKTN